MSRTHDVRVMNGQCKEEGDWAGGLLDPKQFDGRIMWLSEAFNEKKE